MTDSMRKRLLKIIAECEDYIRTVEWWNTNRTDAPPFDCEPERILLKHSQECLEAMNRREPQECQRLAALMLESAQNAVRDDIV